MLQFYTSKNLLRGVEKAARVRPPLRWAGSKRRLLPVILNSLPNKYSSYCEPFAGSASLFFCLQPQNAFLNDLNVELMNFYDVLGTDPEQLHANLLRIPRTKDAYLRTRSALHQTADKHRRAAFFFFLNRNCFNGIYRTNKSGQFNVPFSDSRTGEYPTLSEVQYAAIGLHANATLTTLDFESFIAARAGRNVFFYIDPPYFMPRKRIFSEYQRLSFNCEDVERLFSQLAALDKTGSLFLLSYPDCAQARRLGKKWFVKYATVHRSVAGSLKHRRSQRELLISNYSC
jgi:DNA adenine methylase